MTDLLSARHRDGAKVLTPFDDISDTFGAFGKRSVAVASATGIALTAAVASTATALAPTAAPTAADSDFAANLEASGSATLVSLDMEWDSGDTFEVKAEEPPAPEPEPEPVAAPAATASRSNERASAVVQAPPAARLGSVAATALQFLGVPYVYGGTTPAGFDCSGFTSYVYGLHGISLPRSASSQWGVGVGVSYADAQAGDLVIMNGGGHVGIYLGGGQMVHSPRPGKSVQVVPLSWFNVNSFRRL